MSAPIHVNETLIAPILSFLFQPITHLWTLREKRPRLPDSTTFLLRPSLPLHPILPRARPLTAPLPPPTSPPPTGHNPQRTFPQTQSRLLTTLPFDLRRLIWEACLGGASIHISILHTAHDSRLRYVRCTSPERPLSEQHGCWEGVSAVNRHLISLLLCCRLVYTETHPILYAANTFAIGNEDSIRSLPFSILPQRLSQMRTVHLTWPVQNWGSHEDLDADKVWREIWGVVASMEGLRELHVYLEAHNSYLWFWRDWDEDDVEAFKGLGTVRQVTAPGIFEVRLPYDGQRFFVRDV